MDIKQKLMLFIAFLLLPLFLVGGLSLFLFKNIGLDGCISLVLIAYLCWGFLFDFFRYLTKELAFIKGLNKQNIDKNRLKIETNMRFWYCSIILGGIYSAIWILLAIILPIISKRHNDFSYLLFLPVILFNYHRFARNYIFYKKITKLCPKGNGAIQKETGNGAIHGK